MTGKPLVMRPDAGVDVICTSPHLNAQRFLCCCECFSCYVDLIVDLKVNFREGPDPIEQTFSRVHV